MNFKSLAKASASFIYAADIHRLCAYIPCVINTMCHKINVIKSVVAFVHLFNQNNGLKYWITTSGHLHLVICLWCWRCRIYLLAKPIYFILLCDVFLCARII